MNQWPRAVCIHLAVLVLAAGALTQKQTEAHKTTVPQKPTSSTREFGKSYATLRPEQRRLVDDYVGRYNQTTGSKIVAQTAYDGARMSARTTFDAVTHAPS
jgi:ABC-type sulfate transport system substrate-binding protein